MRKISTLILTAILICTSIPASADRGGHYRGHNPRGSSSSGVVVFGALTGLAIGATILVDRRRPVYDQPAGSWYYCGSSQMYYPYTQSSPSPTPTIPNTNKCASGTATHSTQLISTTSP